MALRRRCYSAAFLSLLVATALLTGADAAIPFFDWRYDVVPANNIPAYLFASVLSTGVTVSTSLNATTGASTLVGLNTTTGAALWLMPSPCNATVHAVTAHPSRESPNAAILIVCGSQYVAVAPANGLNSVERSRERLRHCSACGAVVSVNAASVHAARLPRTAHGPLSRAALLPGLGQQRDNRDRNRGSCRAAHPFH
jgi:hypothetical protein